MNYKNFNNLVYCPDIEADIRRMWSSMTELPSETPKLTWTGTTRKRRKFDLKKNGTYLGRSSHLSIAYAMGTLKCLRKVVTCLLMLALRQSSFRFNKQ